MPAFGSVRHIVPAHLPEAIFGRYSAFCSADPLAATFTYVACDMPGYADHAILAPPNISVTALSTTEGNPWPPNSGLQARPCQPFFEYST
ncbi:hypothetical protein D3C71_1850350 [compost metagenome]